MSKLNKNAKKGQGAAGLLGRVGSGGLGGNPPLKPSTKVPSAAKPTDALADARPTPTTPTGGPGNNPARRTGKPEQRRPTGRAISGG